MGLKGDKPKEGLAVSAATVNEDDYSPCTLDVENGHFIASSNPEREKGNT